MREQRKQTGGNRGARRHQERNQIKKPDHDYDLSYDMSVGDMTRYLKKEFDIDFYTIEQKALKNRALHNDSYLLDIACDIKELLTSEDTEKYFYMDALLSEFKKSKEMV